MARSVARASTFGLIALLTACASSTTQYGNVSDAALHSGQLAIEQDLQAQQRVEDIGHGLLAAAAPFCTAERAPRPGVRFANIHSFTRDLQPAARSLGFSDTLMVVGVARGSAAQRAGFTAGDRVTSLDNGAPPLGPGATQRLAQAIAARPLTTVTLRQGEIGFLSDSTPDADMPPTSAELRTVVPADTVCGYTLVAARAAELNGWADGTDVTVTSAMLRFVVDDDELAAMLAHDIAHNAMRHVQAQQKSAAAGGVSGIVLDISAAAKDVNMPGPEASAGSPVFSPDFEREADYVGMYILARAGWPTEKAASLWRRVAEESPGDIQYASTHPTTPDRIARLEQVSGEIAQKLAGGEELRPEARGAPAAAGSTTARATTAVSNGTVAPAMVAPAPGPPSAHGRTSGKPNAKPADGAAPSAAASNLRESYPAYSTTLSTADSVSYTFGPAAPRNGLSVAQARRRALQAYQDGQEALELRLYEQAERHYREAALYDGGEARYHAALGALLLKRGKRAAAEAVLSAAVLLDVENPTYRQLLLEARHRP